MIARRSALVFVFLMSTFIILPSAAAQTTEIAYQGQLQHSSMPATGHFDLEFLLFDSLSGGSQVGTTVVKNKVAVTNGNFSVTLDFGMEFSGAGRFLEIHVRHAGETSFSTLSPRQPITSSPYSIKSHMAETAETAVTAANATNAVTAQNAARLGGVAANQYLKTTTTGHFVHSLNDMYDHIMLEAGPNIKITKKEKALMIEAMGGDSILNQTEQQADANFNISGNGTLGGTLAVGSLGTGGTTGVCRNAANQIAQCSSSLRYKSNIAGFNSGLELVRRLRPVGFTWRANNLSDVGLVAEEVAAVEPLLTTRNEKGEVEGVKYDRVGVVLVNAVNEQQSQIESQQKLIEQQRKQIELLTTAVCSLDPKAAICLNK